MIERLKSASFWVSLIGAAILILSVFGVHIGDEVASNIVNGVCSALVMFGIASPTGANTMAGDKSDDNDKTE